MTNEKKKKGIMIMDSKKLTIDECFELYDNFEIVIEPFSTTKNFVWLLKEEKC